MNKEKYRGTLYSEVLALSEKSFFFFPSLFALSVLLTDRMQLDLCETILKKCFLCCIFLNVVVFILVKMHGICYCTKVEEVNM